MQQAKAKPAKQVKIIKVKQEGIIKMSCYICNKDTFVKVLKAWTKYGDVRPSYYENDCNSIANLWFDLTQLNYDAVNLRYNEKTENEDALDIPTPEELTKNYSDAELFDALREYQYQCSEGDEYHERRAYYYCNWAKDGMLRKLLDIDY